MWQTSNLYVLPEFTILSSAVSSRLQCTRLYLSQQVIDARV